MPETLALLGLGVLVFASTNVDDIFVLIGFLSDPQFRTRDVVLGQYLGIGVLTLVSLLASLISLVLPPAYIGLLGLFPIGIGLKKLWDLFRGRDEAGEELEGRSVPSRSRMLAVAAVTVANGGDNLGIYTPLFATRTGPEVALLVAVFAILTGVWCLLAHGLINHPALGAPIRRHGRRVLPFVLIGLGVLILYEGGALSWL